MKTVKKGNPVALLPILVFLVLYLGLGCLFEYGLGISMGFYNIPIVVVFLVALLVACVQNRKLSLNDKLVVMGKGLSDPTLVTMIIIFMLAGVFVGTVGRTSADSVAYFLLDLIPANLSVAMLFIIACFVSIAMGTSVGTITLIVPIAVSLAQVTGYNMPLCIASVVSGAMFGDNLSFISDTTIAACQGQGCEMKDKFRENFKIALPAAIVTLIIILALTVGAQVEDLQRNEYDLIQIIPYLLVLVGGIIGFNVIVVLAIGIVVGCGIMLFTGATVPFELLGSMGSGAAGMFETTMVVILVAAICALVREYGGFDALLHAITSVFKGPKGGQLGMGILVGILDVASANNTVAIVVANPIAAEMAEIYGISKRKTASILDTFSCIFQGVIPYGAQMLVAISAAAEMGVMVSGFQVMPLLFYPFMLLISSLIFIFLVPSRQKKAVEPVAGNADAEEPVEEEAATE